MARVLKRHLRVGVVFELSRLMQGCKAFEMLCERRAQSVIGLVATRPYSVSAGLRKSVDLEDGEVGRDWLECDAAEVQYQVSCGTRTECMHLL